MIHTVQIKAEGTFTITVDAEPDDIWDEVWKILSESDCKAYIRREGSVFEQDIPLKCGDVCAANEFGEGYWQDFIGEWTPAEFGEWVKERNEENGTQKAVNEYIRYIVKSVFEGIDYWWTDDGHMANMRRKYADFSIENIVYFIACYYAGKVAE